MKALKPIFGLALVVIIILVGFAKASQWLILPLGVLFTAAYINGKWYAWKTLFKQRGNKFYTSLATTYIIETILVFVLYWMGRGVANLLNF